MLDVLKPFLRILMAVPIMFSAGYLSFFVPYRLFNGDGFSADLQMALVTIGIFAGLLYFSKPKPAVEAYEPNSSGAQSGDESEDKNSPNDPPVA